MPVARLIALALLLFAGTATAQHAASPGTKPSRLERIAASNQIVIGYQEAAPPFSYLDGEQRPIGYGIEVARAVAEAVRARLARPDLPIRYNALTPVTRFPLVVNGVVDIDCGSATNTLERQNLVAFSTTIFISESRIGVPNESDVRGFPDLAGRRVSLVAGTTTERRVEALAAERGMDLKVIPARNNLRAFQALQRGDTDAFVAAEALLAGELARTGGRSGFRIVGDAIEREAFACVLPRAEPAFKRLVDDTITAMMASGELARLYDKWFMQPIPPQNRALGLPMSDAMRALIAAPDDRPLQ